MKRNIRLSSSILLLCFALASIAWTPWGAVYESARDERSISDQASDKAISLGIKKDLADNDAKKALKVHVYCFLGTVYLVGAIDDEKFQDYSMKTAKGTKNVKRVITYFVDETDTTADDLTIAAKVRAALIGEGELSATQIETEVMNGEVVMVGMVRSKKDAALAIKVAKGIEGVRKVTSYLIPPR